MPSREKTEDAARTVEVDAIIGLGAIKAIAAGLDKKSFNTLVEENWEAASKQINKLASE